MYLFVAIATCYLLLIGRVLFELVRPWKSKLPDYPEVYEVEDRQ